MKIVLIDGKEYIEKSSMDTGDYVVIRSKDSGVHAGNLHAKNDLKSGVEVILKNARRIYYWDGAASLSQLSQDGVSKPENCKFPCEVPIMSIFGVCEIIPCSQKAQESIKEVRIWKK